MKNRYPGTRPFTKEQGDVFYGRDDEIESLYKKISFNQIVVLYGKSGLGKSSLINAGLIPRLQKETDYKAIFFRFYANTSNSETSLSKIKNQLKSTLEKETFLDKIIPEEDSLWYWTKRYQIESGRNQYLFVFDQFEELFTYPEESIKQFKIELTELIKHSIPQRFHDIYSILNQNDPTLLTEDEENLFYKDFSIKLLFAIRSDRLHLLDRLSDSIPQILSNNYELRALLPGGARDAIILPASIDGEYDSSVFKYDKNALSEILTFLQDEKVRFSITISTFLFSNRLYAKSIYTFLD